MTVAAGELVPGFSLPSLTQEDFSRGHNIQQQGEGVAVGTIVRGKEHS